MDRRLSEHLLTVRQALQAAAQAFSAVSDSAALDAQVLLGAVMQRGRAWLLAHGDDVLSTAQHDAYIGWMARRAAGEPVAYILGRRAFYDRDFIVTPAVLIPRPETELLLELALAFAQGRPACTTADIGTGSGALAVTLAANCLSADVYAVDISPAALAVAQQNARLHQVQVTFLQGDLLQPLLAAGVQFDLLMANLPYIASDTVPQLAVSRHEPVLALDGGPDGLALVRRLLEDVPAICATGALVLLEIGADQGAAVRALVQALLPGADVSVLPDYAGLDRIVRIVLPD